MYLIELDLNGVHDTYNSDSDSYNTTSLSMVISDVIRILMILFYFFYSWRDN